MKIVTWNCQGSFRTKAEHMARLKPDIAIIQECEALERLTKPGTVWQPAQSWWHGDLRYKGVGIFTFNRTSFTVREPLDPARGVDSPDRRVILVEYLHDVLAPHICTGRR